MDHVGDLRRAAVTAFSKEWDASIAAGLVLAAAFGQLSAQAGRLAEAGCHLHMEFTDPLTQAAWLAFRESQGDLIPRHPEEAPIPAELRGAIPLHPDPRFVHSDL